MNGEFTLGAIVIATNAVERNGLASKWFRDATREMKKINADRLRAIVYDARTRLQQVQLYDDRVGENNNYR